MQLEGNCNNRVRQRVGSGDGNCGVHLPYSLAGRIRTRGLLAAGGDCSGAARSG